MIEVNALRLADLPWMTVHVETGVMDGRYAERADAEGAALHLRRVHGGTWLVVRIASVHGPLDTPIPSDRMHHANMREHRRAE